MSKLQKALFLLYYILRAWRLQRCFKTRDALLKWQDERLLAQANHLHRASSFYRNQRPSKWHSWPQLSKQTMLANFHNLNTLGLTREQVEDMARTVQKGQKGITTGLSSGTSGQAGIFVLSEKEQLQWLAHLLVKIRFAPPWKTQRIALFLRANNRLYSQLNLGRIQFQFFDLMQPLENHLQTLITYQPDILVAPPSVLGVLAIRSKVQPSRVISVAEVFDDLQRVTLEKIWPQAHFDEIYQATEGFLANTCTHGTLHLNEDLLRIEPSWLDDSQIRAHPILWDFSRRTQPFFNYLHDDVLLWSQTPCPCGSIFQPISRIEGRYGDVFTMGGQPLFSETIARAVLLENPPQDYQLIQITPTQLTLSTIPESAFPVIKTTILNAIEGQGLKPPTITQVLWPTLQPGEKFRRFQNKIPK